MKRDLIIIASLLLSGSLAAQTVDDLIDAGRAAFLRYDFSEAAKKYADARKKAKKNVPPFLEEYEEDLEKGENFIERVEKIVILDSISVPREDFFKEYKLPFSAGYLSTSESIPFDNEDTADFNYVFTNEGDDFKMWAALDTAGYYTIRESIRLTDGSWQQPTATPDLLNNGGDAIFPFMMSDGVTLYYASNNEDSLGGYDIFVATRDAADGEYLQPQNIGMPYNSPYDDYLLAIDELNGVGWWATDRNLLGDDITIYLFKVNDLRSNYDPDETENLSDRALVSDWKATWGDNDFSSLVSEVMAIVPGPAKKKGDFIFPMPQGKFYTTMDDFKTSEGKRSMLKYLNAIRVFEEKSEKLSSLRHKYAEGKGASLKSQIRALESELETDCETIRRLKSDIYRVEISH